MSASQPHLHGKVVSEGHIAIGRPASVIVILIIRPATLLLLVLAVKLGLAGSRNGDAASFSGESNGDAASFSGARREKAEGEGEDEADVPGSMDE